ncbi:MAG: hypothetical protein IPP47_08475 [Bryobacterales bacterium]|nr:hypothetical protein [Bryobacterales bacterium]
MTTAEIQKKIQDTRALLKPALDQVESDPQAAKVAVKAAANLLHEILGIPALAPDIDPPVEEGTRG